MELKHRGRHIVFSGDLGRPHSMLFHPPAVLEEGDYLVLESTYGDRRHPQESPLRHLARIVTETLARKGHVIISSFAVGRTQELLLLFSKLKAQHLISNVPIFLDSPMGINATEVFTDYPSWHKLSASDVKVKALREAATMVRSSQQSQELTRASHSTVVIAGSGMLAGGRILHHLETRLADERNTVLVVGYQATGTRGRLLLDGINELKFHGHYVPVKAHVEELSALSAHADQAEIIEWLKGFRSPPKQTFLVHGESQPADALRVKIHDVLGWSCHIPRALDKLEL